jgi:hypothetical protein
LPNPFALTAPPAGRAPLAALALALSVAAAALAAGPAHAGNGKGKDKSNDGGGSSAAPAALPLCTLSDLSTGVAACSGFFQGNLLSNSGPDLAAQAQGLAAIGLANWNGAIAEPQINLSSSLVDFQTALKGVTWIGIHFGGGTASPSPHTPGGVTAFYRFDAGTNLNTFTLNYGSASAARLYATGAPPSGLGSISDNLRHAVPEPAAWAMMILGFGAAGAVLRRRRALLAP